MYTNLVIGVVTEDSQRNATRLMKKLNLEKYIAICVKGFFIKNMA